ncbi:hypothetical protein ACS0TY_025442 [Phlomoides rotata]
MDFGAVGFDNLLSSNSAAPPSNNGGTCFASETDADVIKRRLYGSGFLKQGSGADEDVLRAFKLAKTNSSCAKGSNASEHRPPMLSFSPQSSQMLCFSSQNSSFPFYNGASEAVSRSAGYGLGGMNWTSMQSGVRGPFSQSQWMELEHQALIYKYITANVPIPSYLLNPIRKALESSGFSCFSLLRSNALGWGGFHLGFSNTDPEPGRCRRTDGKKWRCSRDAVPEQKYCERHINRGRHRSRKPVEGQPGHSVSGTTTNVVVPDGGAVLPHRHQTNARPASNDQQSGKTGTIDRSVVDKETAAGAYRQTTFHSMASPKTGFKDNNQQSGFKELSRPEFGLVCSDSLLNPLNRSSSLVNNRNYDNFNDSESKSENVIRQFMEVYPKNHSPRLPVSWSDVDRTQLSISIPTASPTNEKHTISPLRLSMEGEATRMGLSVGANITSEQNQRQNNWVPISSIGGPLGEALHTTGECKNSKALNLIENWDHSPRAESSKGLDGVAFCNGLIGQGLMLPSLPAL